MGREIKFRFRINTPLGFMFVYKTLKELMEEGFRDRMILNKEQFTGLKDKNGVEIYEGDIIKVCHWYTYVKWFEHSLCFDLENAPRSITEYELEVVGNTHENKELLEDE